MRRSPVRPAPRRRALAAAGAAACLLAGSLLAGCSGDDGAAPPAVPASAVPDVVATPVALPVAAPAQPSDAPRGPYDTEPVLVPAADPPPAGGSVTAPALVAQAPGAPVVVRSSPAADAPSATFAASTPLGSPRVFLVVEDRGDWLHVLLPGRPLGASGWVARDDVELEAVQHRVVVERGARRLTVFDGDEPVLEAPVVVGVPATPTPVGQFFVTDLLNAPDPGGAFGPQAFGLSGRSEELTTFAGGDGQLALHGTNRPALLGSDASNGCVRLANDVLEQLVGLLPLGTPVEVVA